MAEEQANMADAGDEEEIEVEMEDEPEAEVEMEVELGAEEEEEEPAAPAEPEEPEKDEETDLALRPKREVGLSAVDATPDVFLSASGAVSKLQQGAFAHLLSGVRATSGARGGRFLFEVKVLEEVPDAKQELRVGFSLAGSSLFLGDGSVDGVGFGMDGTYFMAEPGQLTSMHRADACKALSPNSVIGVVLNLDAASPAANTVSIFLDGVRAGPPQPVPSHLRGKGLFPTVTFRGLSLAVNFGQAGRQLKALPFKCCLFSQLDEAHSAPAAPHAEGESELLVPVGLPDGGLFNYVVRFKEGRPDMLELSDGSFQKWCEASGVKCAKKRGPAHSQDEPDFSTGIDSVDDLSWQEALLRVAQCSGRSALSVGVRSGLLRSERERLLARFPASMKKIAVVALGEPTAGFKAWVHEKVKTEYETKKALQEKRELLAEASGVTLEDAGSAVPAVPPALDDSVWFLPRGDAEGVPDVSAKALASHYAKFCLPTEAEGFSEVRYEWLGKDAAQAHLTKWVQERKAQYVVEGLKPGHWFQAKLEEWKEERKKLRKGHSDFTERKKKESSYGDDAATVDLASVADIHNADGDGVPAYADFKYEDWLLLSWRYELHLLVHAFVEDVADEDMPGIPEDHVAHYFKLYFGQALEPKEKLGADDFVKALTVLKEPLELVELRPGQKILKSKLDRTTAPEDFVKSVELYRRDRTRRLDAGDESAQLTFPKPQKPVPVKAAPGKAVAPQSGAKGAGKGAAGKGAAGKGPTPPAKAAPGGKAGGKAAVAKQPIVKAVIAKSAPKAAIAKVGGGQLPGKGGPVVEGGGKGDKGDKGGKGGKGGKGSFAPAGLKRPMPPAGAPPGAAFGNPALKRPRPPLVPPHQIAKAPIAKRKPA